LLITYAVGLLFTLGTHSNTIYPKKRPSRRNYSPQDQSLSNPTPIISRKGKKIVPEQRPTEIIRDYSFLFIQPDRDGIFVGTFSAKPESDNSASSERPEKKTMPKDNHVNLETASDVSVESHTHANPGWGILKSCCILLACTVIYALIAEILIDSVDVVLSGNTKSEKFLGMTLFAIVPTVTEFCILILIRLDNAISFAMNGRIALSLEIGSAYAIQVALVQIPTILVFSSGWAYYNPAHISFKPFILVFPQWDLYAVLFSVFLLTYVYLEGKSNYFKGAILLLCYAIMLAAYFFEP
jgi:Ca2+/H+ antiporter